MRHCAIASPVAAILLMLAGCSRPEAADSAEPPRTEAAVEAPVPAPAADADYVPAQQVGDIPIERVEFDPGANAITIADSIQGTESVDYVVKARAGQPLDVAMETANAAAYFNLIEPGETDVAVHIGSVAGNHFAGTAEETGDYRIRVYMLRSAARREEKADYRIDITLG